MCLNHEPGYAFMDLIGELEGGGPEGMKARNGGRLRAAITRWFPERQIYHRAEGKVSYVTISTGVQLACVGALVMVAAWLAFASTSFALRGHAIDIRAAASQSKLARYERLLQEARSREASALALLETRTSEFRQIADDFEVRHAALRVLMGDDSDLTAPTTRVAATPAVAATAQSQAPARPAQMHAVALRGDAADQPAALRIAALRVEQERMMSLAADVAEARITAAREAIAMAGLKVEDLLAEPAQGVGGPLVELDLSEIAPGLDLDEEFGERFAEVAERVAEAEDLARAIAAAPFRTPVPVDHRVSSTFGGRVDPFTRRTAYHTGLDLAAYHRAPVVTTAAGVVSFSGWRGGYGRTIEVDHGNGFKTRYGHLSQIHVETGDKVSAGDLIGSMGSTGRSTGTHLHYEVWFQGKVQDPSKFLKAGRHVQQS